MIVDNLANFGVLADTVEVVLAVATVVLALIVLVVVLLFVV